MINFFENIGALIMHTPIKKLALAVALASTTSVLSAGPIAPAAGPLSGTPLASMTGQLSALDMQLGDLSAGGLPIDDSVLAEDGSSSGASLPADPGVLAGGGLPNNPRMPVDQTDMADGDNSIAAGVLQLTSASDTLAANLAGSGGTTDAATNVVDTAATDPAETPASIGAVPPTLQTATANLQANMAALSGSAGGGPSLPLDPTAGGGGDAPDTPGASSLPVDPTTMAGGDASDTPSASSLPVDPTNMAGGDTPGESSLPVDPASLTGGGENPYAAGVMQLTYTVDTLADNLAGRGGTFDATTDVVDALITDPAGAQSSVAALPPTLENTAANLETNLMALSGSGGGADSPVAASVVLTTPVGILMLDNSGPSFK